jgi:myo-inositol-1-phosphate synthase
MAPIATNTTNGDSFASTRTAAPTNGFASGVAVHATARRSPPGGLIQVDGNQTVYDEVNGEIRSRFVDRGAEVTSEFLFVPSDAALRTVSMLINVWVNRAETPEGKLNVKRTERMFEFKTNTKVGKVG